MLVAIQKVNALLWYEEFDFELPYYLKLKLLKSDDPKEVKILFV